MANYRDLSKFISLILRHKPEVIGISLDDHGWANVDELLAGIRRTRLINMEILEEIVRADEKQRYTFNEDHTRIRANQGHSIQVDVELEEEEPPEYLFHGTGRKYVEFIDQIGLIPKSRLYVHLSGDQETAMKVGKRHGGGDCVSGGSRSNGKRRTQILEISKRRVADEACITGISGKTTVRKKTKKMKKHKKDVRKNAVLLFCMLFG